MLAGQARSNQPAWSWEAAQSRSRRIVLVSTQLHAAHFAAEVVACTCHWLAQAVQGWNTTCGCQLPCTPAYTFPTSPGQTVLSLLNGWGLWDLPGKAQRKQTSVTTRPCSALPSCQHLPKAKHAAQAPGQHQPQPALASGRRRLRQCPQVGLPADFSLLCISQLSAPATGNAWCSFSSFDQSPSQHRPLMQSAHGCSSLPFSPGDAC